MTTEEFIALKKGEYQAFVDTLIGKGERDFLLAESCFALFVYLRAFQQNINFADEDLGAGGLAAKQTLTQVEQNVFIPLKAKKEEILAAIAAYDPEA